MPPRRDSAVPEKVDVQMTPMIDIVFQLMAFFLMTFQVAPVEADFALKLPRTDIPRGMVPTMPETIVVRLQADTQGELAALRYSGDAQANPSPGRKPDDESFRRLRTFVEQRIGEARSAGQEEPAVTIAADDLLRYEHIIRTIDAVSGTPDESGNVRPLARKITFE